MPVMRLSRFLDSASIMTNSRETLIILIEEETKTFEALRAPVVMQWTADDEV